MIQTLTHDIGKLKRYGISEEVALNAHKTMQERGNKFFAISGRIASGKDTVGEEVFRLMGTPTEDIVHEFYARPLRDEVDQVIRIIRDYDQDEATTLIVNRLSASTEEAEHMYDILREPVRSGQVYSSYQRTQDTRKALQFWGTEVRRSKDEDYWVRKTLIAAMNGIIEGKNVYITDARFPNEIDALVAVGAKTFRLLVSPEAQNARIMKRDGIPVTPEAQQHASETALDGYSGFYAIIDTNVKTLHEVAQEVLKGIQA